MDEIHERHQDLDCLLFLLKTLPEETGHRPKIILMSATAESNLYAEYFGVQNCNRVTVEGEGSGDWALVGPHQENIVILMTRSGS